jgi:hypothetical protein
MFCLYSNRDQSFDECEIYVGQHTTDLILIFIEKSNICCVFLYVYINVHTVSDCCLTPTHHFSAILWREQVNFQGDDVEVRFVLFQHVLVVCYSAISLKRYSTDRHVTHSDTLS